MFRCKHTEAVWYLNEWNVHAVPSGTLQLFTPTGFLECVLIYALLHNNTVILWMRPSVNPSQAGVLISAFLICLTKHRLILHWIISMILNVNSVSAVRPYYCILRLPYQRHTQRSQSKLISIIMATLGNSPDDNFTKNRSHNVVIIRINTYPSRSHWKPTQRKGSTW